jgi:hypothetical protein
MVLVRFEVFPVVDYARYVTARTYGVVVSQYRCFTLNPFPMDAADLLYRMRRGSR